MNHASAAARDGVTALAQKDAPALIEVAFPAQKISFEAQKERKAGAGQTLTGLGSYWKGRKPLILVRAIVLGILLPQTSDAEADLEIFEKLLAIDNEGLARRALANNSLKPKDIAALVQLEDPWKYFRAKINNSGFSDEDIARWTFPLGAERLRVSISWQQDVSEEDKLALYRKALATFTTYEEKAALCKRPEEVEQTWLYAPIWHAVNAHYAHLGIVATSFPELMEQLGTLRYGHRPRIGDTFCGGGSIPFEAARLGCDVYASDLNPIACMLTWGALNIIGESPRRRAEIEVEQRNVAKTVDEEITRLGIEHDASGNRAKGYLYCLETRCPETGWMVPMSPSWVISNTSRVVARLRPDHTRKSFEIDIVTDASAAEMKTAESGTVQDGSLVYDLKGKTHRIPIKTLRGDYRDGDGNTQNRLRRWEKQEFKPRPEDIFQERLYAIQWITKESLNLPSQEVFFASVTAADLEREHKVEEIVAQSFNRWQEQGLVPDMAIEPGDKTDEPIRTRGWTYWHHLFSPRQLLQLSMLWQRLQHFQWGALCFANLLNYLSKLTAINPRTAGSGRQMCIDRVFINQALNTLFNWGVRSYAYFPDTAFKLPTDIVFGRGIVEVASSDSIIEKSDIFVTDPPYADAVIYHEITEYFIAWLRKAVPSPFDRWIWDSRRALAIKGSGNDFRRGMVSAYRAMAEHMPNNGMQCVMFTHQDTSVWSDMVGIFWAAGLQVVAAWYIATETTSERKKGGYVQGTVILMLAKRPPGERVGFKQRILPAVRTEVERQIQGMMHLNDEVREKHGEPVFNDSDLQMGGYAAALKVLTAYTHIGGEDVRSLALRPRQRGDVTVVDDIVQQAAEAANNLLVPQGVNTESWAKLSGIQRFYLRMMDMETTGASKLDNYQNFAKAFRVQDYARVMGNITANKARLKHVPDFTSRDLTESTEIGNTWLGRLIIGMQQLMGDTEPQTVISQLQAEMPDFIEVRPVLIDILSFFERNALEPDVRIVAEVFGARLRNIRALGQ
jgi:putative DNA methylase